MSFTNKMSPQEYELIGKETTEKALEDLQEQMKTFKRPEYTSDLESINSSDENEDLINFNKNYSTNIMNELSKFKVSKLNKYKNEDKVLVLFDELLTRNNTLLKKNLKLQHKHRKVSKELKSIESKEYSKQIFANSKTMENNDLKKINAKLEEDCKNNKNILGKSERVNYISRFTIGVQFMLIIYMYLVLNANTFLIFN